MALLKQIGTHLLTKAGKKSTEEVLQGTKYVLAYFSAHWCPPCKRFTPELAKFYTQNKEKHAFEIVFFSLDRDADSFEEYYASMPWAAVPFEAETRQTFAQKHGGEGIPELVVFDTEGTVIAKNGVEMVMTDTNADNFPWAPPTWEECLGTTLVSQDGTEHAVADALKGKSTIGVYCSAHWCGPCRVFTPELASFYEAYKAKDPSFEIIFCSADKSNDEMMSYFKDAHAPYYCLPYDAPSRKLMSSLVDAKGIPHFAVFNSEGKLLNNNARAKVSAGADVVASEGWMPPPVGDIKDGPESNGVDINSAAAVLIRCEGCDDDEQASVVSELTAVAKESFAAEEGTPETIFFYSKTKSPIGDQLGALMQKEGSKRCKMPDDEPLMLYIDIPKGGAFYEALPVDITAASIKDFVARCKEGKESRLQLSR